MTVDELIETQRAIALQHYADDAMARSEYQVGLLETKVRELWTLLQQRPEMVQVPEVFRWWDGHRWSGPFVAHDDIRFVARVVKRPDPCQRGIEWTDRPESWPERSRT